MAALFVLVSWVHPPLAVTTADRSQVQALVRVLMCSVVGANVLLVPGLVLRDRVARWSALPLGGVPLIGVLVLGLVGVVVWLTAPSMSPLLISRLAVLALLFATACLSWRRRRLIDSHERFALVATGLVFLVALGKSLWSLDPDGTLYSGSISRTLEVGDRPDSRISYHVTSIVAHGLAPYGQAASSLFAPYNFLDRGPIPGFAATPLMLAAGTVPTLSFPSQPWSAFDPQGFMVYRVAMMMFALIAILALHSLMRRLSGPTAARYAVIVAATTPFVVHETYFTWPKLMATALCLLAAHAVFARHALAAGTLVGLGYLCHPLALLTLPTLGLLAIGVVWSDHRWRKLVAAEVSLGLGVALTIGSWLAVNHGHHGNGGFINYVKQSNAQDVGSLAAWLGGRGDSVANTLVPLYLMHHPDDPHINSIYGPSDGVVHFFFQYWTGLPFGGAIVWLPVTVAATVVAWRRCWPAVAALVVLPFLLFAIYWGSYASGLMREGLHPWVFTLIAVLVAFGRPRSWGDRLPLWLRMLLALRLVEVALMLLAPTIDSRHRALGLGHALGDVVSLATVAVGLAGLAWIAVRGTRPSLAGADTGARSIQP